MKRVRAWVAIASQIACSNAPEIKLAGPGALASVGAPTGPNSTECRPESRISTPCADPVAFTQDVFPKFAGAWACSVATCHGGAAEPKMSASAEETYESLVSYKRIDGKPYVNPCSQDANASTFACNVATTGTCGKKMPFSPGVFVEADYDLVVRWLRCGAQK